MAVGPFAYFLQACPQRLTVTALVHILDVHDLEARLLHDRRVREGWIRRQSGVCHPFVDGRMAVASSFRIRIHVQFDLVHAIIELLCQPEMAVVESGEILRLGFLP